MPQFWLTTFDLRRPSAANDVPSDPAERDEDLLAIEVIALDEPGCYAVLFSIVDDLQSLSCFRCRLGFTNAPEACNRWRDNGFPIIDAAITLNGDTLQVVTPFFGAAENMRYDGRLLLIEGFRLSLADAGDELTSRYEQVRTIPDPVSPATRVRAMSAQWQLTRTRVTRRTDQPAPRITLEATRYPVLRPFDRVGGACSLWCGELALAASRAAATPDPMWRAIGPTGANAPKPQRLARRDVYGVPAFRFDDVEVIGFRLDLGRTEKAEQDLQRLIAPLNFHLTQARDDAWLPDFRYRPATHTVLIELLRYGRMRLQVQEPPLTLTDYQSQHELVVRVLVGRVNDDTAQAHDAAVYVPAIFVDNPWSKTIGRDVQGFDKRLAQFCVADLPLLPDGRSADHPEPCLLADVAAIRLAGRVEQRMAGSSPGRQPPASPVAGAGEEQATILEIDCSRRKNWDSFQSVDLRLALGSFPGWSARWRQTDFDAMEFRRSFARDVVLERLRGFRSVQVSPLPGPSDDGEREATWITSSFEFDDDVRIAFPDGGATLRIHHHEAAPIGWRRFCDAVGLAAGESEMRSFQSGSWYRMRCSLSMNVDDGLQWT